MSSSPISRPRYLSSAIAQQYETLLFGTQGKNARVAIFTSAHAPPHRRDAHARHIPGHHQQLGFVRLQLLGRRGRLRPPHEPPFGKTLLRKPVSLAVIAEQPNRRPSPAPENKHTATDGVFRKLALADANQRIDY